MEKTPSKLISILEGLPFEPSTPVDGAAPGQSLGDGPNPGQSLGDGPQAPVEKYPVYDDDIEVSLASLGREISREEFAAVAERGWQGTMEGFEAELPCPTNAKTRYFDDGSVASVLLDDPRCSRYGSTKGGTKMVVWSRYD